MLIHSLNLAGNNIHSEGLIDLGNAIRSSQALRHVKEIVLDWNPLGEASPQCTILNQCYTNHRSSSTHQALSPCSHRSVWLLI